MGQSFWSKQCYVLKIFYDISFPYSPTFRDIRQEALDSLRDSAFWYTEYRPIKCKFIFTLFRQLFSSWHFLCLVCDWGSVRSVVGRFRYKRTWTRTVGAIFALHVAACAYWQYKLKRAGDTDMTSCFAFPGPFDPRESYSLRNLKAHSGTSIAFIIQTVIHRYHSLWCLDIRPGDSQNGENVSREEIIRSAFVSGIDPASWWCVSYDKSRRLHHHFIDMLLKAASYTRTLQIFWASKPRN